MDNAVYIVFSATPTGMGRIIRLATRHRYNHVSLSLSEDVQKLYSFARYHRTIPLYGGYVEESILRYASFAGQAKIKVCRVEVPEPQLTYLRNYLERLWNEREDYLYNTPAALASLIHRHPAIPKTHTCVTFIKDILIRCRLPGAETIRCPTVRRLERLLEDHTVYEGPAPTGEAWGADPFPAVTSIRYAVYTTARHFGQLAKRLVLGVGG